MSQVNRLGIPAAMCAMLLCASVLAAGPREDGHEPKSIPQVIRQGVDSVADARPTQVLREQERLVLLRGGEQAMALGDGEAAEVFLNRAAAIAHSPDTEMALVRSYMQQGKYRRALAFGAHTAGAHLEQTGGVALYAWLLHLGGQTAVARQVLQGAALRSPGDVVLNAITAQIAGADALPTGLLMRPPLRMAPYGTSAGLTAAARTQGSAVLFDGGRGALVPSGQVTQAQAIWVRNGMGQMARARVERSLSALGVSVLRLERALPDGGGLRLAPGDAFPGSVAYASEYVSSADAAPRWPRLAMGFLGAPTSHSTARNLGIELPRGSRGGPVFDRAGRFVGMAVEGKGAQGDRLLLAATLQRALVTDNPAMLGTRDADGALQPLDGIYENALSQTLQVIVRY